MTTENKNSPADKAEAVLKGYVEQLVDCIQQLRREQNIADTEQIEAYITDTQVVRSMMKQYRPYIEQQTNAADLVQVNDDAGNPMPEALPQTEFHIGDQEVSIAIKKA